MLKYFLFAAVAANLVVFAVSTCTTDESNVADETVKTYMSSKNYSDEATEIVTRMANAYTKWTMTRCFQMGMMHPTGNRMTSLAPLFAVAGAAATIETGELQAQNLGFMNLKNVSEVNTGIQIMLGIVNTETDYGTFNMSLRLFEDTTKPYSQTFKDGLTNFGLTTASIDNSNPTEAAATIVAYAKSVTDYEAKAIITENGINSKNPGAIVAGASKITTQWGSALKVADAGNMDFNVVDLTASTSTISVPSMKVSGPMKKGTYGDATVLSMPLAGLCEFVIVTNAKSGFPFLNLMYTLSDTKKFNEIVLQGETQNAHVLMPDISHSTGTEHCGSAMKMFDASHGMMVPDDCNVCNGVYDDCTDCSYLQTMTHNLEWVITSPCAETSERRRRDTTDAASDSTSTDTASDSTSTDTASDSTSTDTASNSTSTDTADCDDSAWPEYTVNKAFVALLMCPLKTPHMAVIYNGNE